MIRAVTRVRSLRHPDMSLLREGAVVAVLAAEVEVAAEALVGAVREVAESLRPAPARLAFKTELPVRRSTESQF